MTGTLVNTAAVLAGSALGVGLSGRLPMRIKEILLQGLGLSTVFIGISMAVSGSDSLLVVGCVVAGGLCGEILRIEDQLARLAEGLKAALKSGSDKFVEGFVSASLMYLVGPITILGCLADGVSHDPELLYIKSILDGFAALALASSLGVGVLFSAVSVFVVQAAITLGAGHLGFLQEKAVLSAITATGGVLILGIGLNLLELKKIRTGNLLPALVFAVIAAMMKG
ncbi:MAG: DUF554 domain-containing protein [Thermodesulfobacteriota bacterium]